MRSEILFETERLAFRRFLPGDAIFIFDLNSEPEVMKYTGDNACTNLTDAEKVITDKIQPHYLKTGFGRWAVVYKSTDELIGWCGLKFDEDRGTVDVGYRFLKKYWGMGIATEAVKACLKIGFEKYDLDSISAYAKHGNIASVRVMQKAGMHFVRNIFENGEELIWYEKHFTEK